MHAIFSVIRIIRKCHGRILRKKKTLAIIPCFCVLCVWLRVNGIVADCYFCIWNTHTIFASAQFLIEIIQNVKKKKNRNKLNASRCLLCERHQTDDDVCCLNNAFEEKKKFNPDNQTHHIS